MSDKKHHIATEVERESRGTDQKRGEMGPEDFLTTRREFLKLSALTGFLGGVLASCQKAPIEKAIPLLNPPVEYVPGKALWYATTCGGCSAGCGVNAKVREGRPIKLEGLSGHPISGGGLCAAGQASLWTLYDQNRLSKPLWKGETTSWEEIDSIVLQTLESLQSQNRTSVFITPTLPSPTVDLLLSRMAQRFPSLRRIIFDPAPATAVRKAYMKLFGRKVFPHFRFDLAKVILGIECDFLGSWVSPVEFARQWAARRDPDHPERMSYHMQWESTLTVTGAKADRRVELHPRDIHRSIFHLGRTLASRLGRDWPVAGGDYGKEEAIIEGDLIELLLQSQGEVLVACGLNDLQCQLMVAGINHLLGSYGNTIELNSHCYQKMGDEGDIWWLREAIENKTIGGLITVGINPLYHFPDREFWRQNLPELSFTLHLTLHPDEMSSVASVVLPLAHYLESWGDAVPQDGVYSVLQPLISPYEEAKSLSEVLARWSGSGGSGLEEVQRTAKDKIYPLTGYSNFSQFWDDCLKKGWVEFGKVKEDLNVGSFNWSALKFELKEGKPGDKVLIIYTSPVILDGFSLPNALLYELPDPITKQTWGNCAVISPRDASEMGVRSGEELVLKTPTGELLLPALVQPGQCDGVVGVALGWGGEASRMVNELHPRWWKAQPNGERNGKIGEEVSHLAVWGEGLLSFTVPLLEVTPTGHKVQLAIAQEYGSLGERGSLTPKGAHARSVIYWSTLNSYQASPPSVVPSLSPEGTGLWSEDHQYAGHKWGMVVDLNRCIGCGACVVACQVENNIPVVGKDEVRRSREMHWIRIDRYYFSEGERMRIAFQPMLCQHCDHAPCETVCPVLATVHSSEGINQQVYNRCVGTRYCSNNCPYKVRRFNWFNYSLATPRHRLMLNPDVVVRSRGVMEKCTFCYQRIQQAKIEARTEGRELKDGEVQPACVQSCPTKALVFGDLNNPQSEVSTLMSHPRRFKVLEELNVRPSVGYLALIVNDINQVLTAE